MLPLYQSSVPPLPQLLLCAPKIAGLLCAPKPAAPPPLASHPQTPQEALFDWLNTYLDAASARLQARFAEIDREVEALRLAYNIRPVEITLTPPKTNSSTGGAA